MQNYGKFNNMEFLTVRDRSNADKLIEVVKRLPVYEMISKCPVFFETPSVIYNYNFRFFKHYQENPRSFREVNGVLGECRNDMRYTKNSGLFESIKKEISHFYTLNSHIVIFQLSGIRNEEFDDLHVLLHELGHNFHDMHFKKVIEGINTVFVKTCELYHKSYSHQHLPVEQFANKFMYLAAGGLSLTDLKYEMNKWIEDELIPQQAKLISDLVQGKSSYISYS